MRLLLDTHVLLWWLSESSRLSPATRGLFVDSGNELLWSAASTWELAIKLQLGKLRLPHGGEDHANLAGFVARTIVDQSLTPLGVEHTHAARVPRCRHCTGIRSTGCWLRRR